MQRRFRRGEVRAGLTQSWDQPATGFEGGGTVVQVLEVNDFNAVRISLGVPGADPFVVLRRGNQAGNDQLPHAEAGKGRPLLREDLRSDQGLRVLLRQVQARPLQGHRLRQVRRRGRAEQGPPRAHGPHRAGIACQPHLVRQGHAKPARPAARHLAPQPRARPLLRSVHDHARRRGTRRARGSTTCARRWTARPAAARRNGRP